MAGFIEYFPQALSFGNLIILVIGVIVGLIMGALPGISPTLAVALLVPFTLFLLMSDDSGTSQTGNLGSVICAAIINHDDLIYILLVLSTIVPIYFSSL